MTEPGNGRGDGMIGLDAARLQRRRAARAARERQLLRRRLGAGLLLGVAAVVIVVIALAGAGAGTPASPASRTADATGVRPAPSKAPLHPKAPAVSPLSSLRRETIAQGKLPQTEARPSAHTARFRALMAALWQGVATGSDNPALPAFFPKGAYEQLKAIYNVGSDWTDRLVHDYGLDIAAAHRLLGAHPSQASFRGVDVVASYGHWVPSGVCDNSIGYYEMPDARVVYSLHGALHSFGIASMISWRGVWYVVHLGAILRPADTGLVDEPSAGRGSSVYSGTC